MMPMKKFSLLFAAVVILSVACDVADNKEHPINGTKNRIAATTEISTSPRTTMGEGYSVVWSQDDQLILLGEMNDDASNYDINLYTLVEGAGTTNGLFEGTLSSSFDTYYALYPSSTLQGYSPGGVFLLSLPVENAIYTERNFVDGANPMYGVGTMENGIKFKNLCGILELQVKGAGTIAEMHIEADQALSGHFLVTNGETTLQSMEGYDQYATIIATISPAITLSESTPRSIYAILPPATYTHLSITTIDTAGNSTTLTASNPVTITRSVITPVSEFTHSSSGGGGGGGGSDSDDSQLEDPNEKPEIDW